MNMAVKRMRVCYLYTEMIWILTKPQLIDIPSFALSPVAPVRFSRSEPAKSVK